jgi:metal-responsive CopG/Arc/MetJ family transcriptional regulator
MSATAGRQLQRVSVALERGLVKRATAIAKKRRISRSTLLAELLKQALSKPE